MSDVKVRDPRVTYVAEVEIDGLVLDYQLLDLLEELTTVNGWSDAVLIHDRATRDRLGAMGLAQTNVRGSSYGMPKLRKWLDRHRDAIVEGLRESGRRAEGRLSGQVGPHQCLDIEPI